MTNQSDQSLIITMPAGFAPSGGTNTLMLPMVKDSEIRGGKRAIERAFVDANGSGPVRRQRVEWNIHGPLGASLESSAGFLGLNMCITGDSVVTLGDDVRAVTRRAYHGEIVKLTTAHQHVLTATPNHPVLTHRGWVDAGNLRDGDYLVSRRLSDRTGDGRPDSQHVQASISEIYRLAERLSDVPRGRFLPMHLNEERGQSDVDVVAVNGELWNRVKSALPQPVREFAFASTDVKTVGLMGQCDLSAYAVAGKVTPDRRPQLGHLDDAFVGSHSIPDCNCDGAGSRPSRRQLLRSSRPHIDDSRFSIGAKDAPTFEPELHRGLRDAEDWRDDPWGLPFEVELDRLVLIERNPFRGHVYNLETDSHKYLASNIVTHNCRNLDGRWFQRLIPTAKQTLVDLTGDDPPGIDGSIFDISIFDTDYFGSSLSGSGHSADGPDVVVFAEQNDYLLVFRGQLLTQVDTTTTPWTVITTTVLDAPALDADHWRGTVKVALGSGNPMQRVVAVLATGPVLEDVVATTPSETVYGSAIKRGSDRAWYINANQAESTYNFAGFTLDDFVNLANPFQVGDPDAGMNGIGPFGPLTMFGGVDNLYSFTDQGKPVPLSRALYSHHSVWNGQQWADPGWTWNFAISSIGLRAISPGNIDNPVGIGETMRQFTGHNGIAYAVYSERGELQVIYYTTAGDIYGYRGNFGPETAASGQPLLFPWFYKASSWSQAIFSTVTGAPDQGVFLIRGDGTNLVHSTIASDGRDDLYPSYTYDIAGPFAAYLTTLNRNANLQKTLRLARFRTRNLTSGSSWALAFAFDANQTDITNASYVTVGTVTTNGPQTLVPTTASAPTANISGRTLTPRLTLIAGGAGASTTPPEIDGTLEVEYDERPEQFEQISVAVYFTSVSGRDENEVWRLMAGLVGQDAPVPVLLEIPDNLPPGVTTASNGGSYYALLTGVTKRTDLTRDDVEGYTLTFDCWPQAEAL